MKKVILLLILTCASLAANAQAYIGGTLGLGVATASSGSNSATAVSVGIAPEAGYYFNRTWALGASLGVNHQSVSDDNVTTFYVLPYVRASFAHTGSFDFFCELAMGYAHESNERYGAGGFAAALRPGFVAHLSKTFGLTGRMNLMSFTHQGGFVDVNTFSFEISNKIELGMQFTF